MLIFRRARLAAAVVTETPVVLGLVAAVVLPRTVVLIGPGATSREAVGRTLRIGDRRRQRRLPEHREKHRSSGPHQRESLKGNTVGSAPPNVQTLQIRGVKVHSTWPSEEIQICKEREKWCMRDAKTQDRPNTEQKACTCTCAAEKQQQKPAVYEDNYPHQKRLGRARAHMLDAPETWRFCKA